MKRRAHHGHRNRNAQKPVERPQDLSPIPTAAPSEEPQVDEVLSGESDAYWGEGVDDYENENEDDYDYDEDDET